MLTRNFKKLSKSDVVLAGGKGASLGEMTQAGISVPPGFVVLSEAFEKFIDEQEITADIDAILHKVKHQDTASVERASEEIKAIILGTEMPKNIATEIKSEFKKLGAKFVAVRSSATAEDSSSAAWAGQLDSFLNTTEKKLLENVKQCWASLFTPRAIFYRFEKGLDAQKISVAVVVQKMVESEVSGIAFSVHPVTQDRNQLIIEASYGLGEAIVSGQVTPDSYIVAKQPRSIIERMVQAKSRGLYRLPKGENEWKNIAEPKASKQAISNKQVLELSKLILHIEDHYGFPCDIEWALEKGKFYIVQSRPITTLMEQDVTVPKYEKLFSRDFCLASVGAWVRGESTDPKGWTNSTQPFLPYIVTQRSDSTVHFYYDLQGVNWAQGLLVKCAHEDKAFLKKIEKEILARLAYLQPIYEKEKILNLLNLKKFMKELEAGYPWLEAMWWFCQMDSSKVKGLNIKAIEKIRIRTDKLCNGSDRVIRKSLAKIYPKLGDLVSVLSVDEIASGNLPSRNELEKREAGYFFGGEILMSGLNLLEAEDKFKVHFIREDIDENIKTFKGEIAQKGIARGIVRRVMGYKQMAQVEAGEILVSPMTMPGFLPAMERAVAFVTDEGGITCHAGIAARELKKPCIIGTKIATQVLKDGDLVEVDANMGIVRRI